MLICSNFRNHKSETFILLFEETEAKTICSQIEPKSTFATFNFCNLTTCLKLLQIFGRKSIDLIFLIWVTSSSTDELCNLGELQA